MAIAKGIDKMKRARSLGKSFEKFPCSTKLTGLLLERLRVRRLLVRSVVPQLLLALLLTGEIPETTISFMAELRKLKQHNLLTVEHWTNSRELIRQVLDFTFSFHANIIIHR